MLLWTWKHPFGSKDVDFLPSDKQIWILSAGNLDHGRCLAFIQKLMKSAGLQNITHTFSWDKQMLLEREMVEMNVWPWHTCSCSLPANPSQTASSNPLLSLMWPVNSFQYCSLLTQVLAIIIEALFGLQMWPWKKQPVWKLKENLTSPWPVNLCWVTCK